MRRLAIAIILIVCGAGVMAGAQSRRAPTPAEAAALTTFYGAVLPVLDQFADENWAKDADDFRSPEDESISTHASVPLDNCIGGTRTYLVKPDSPRFTAMLKPLYDRVQMLTDQLTRKMSAGTMTTGDVQELKDLHARITQLNQVKVDVCGNRPTLSREELLPDAPSILPNVTAHKVAADACGGDVPACYVLVYGNWKRAKADAARERYVFAFAHPAASPFVENMVITIRGADDRILELLKRLDWARLNAGLTE